MMGAGRGGLDERRVGGRMKVGDRFSGGEEK